MPLTASRRLVFQGRSRMLFGSLCSGQSPCPLPSCPTTRPPASGWTYRPQRDRLRSSASQPPSLPSQGSWCRSESALPSQLLLGLPRIYCQSLARAKRRVAQRSKDVQWKGNEGSSDKFWIKLSRFRIKLSIPNKSFAFHFLCFMLLTSILFPSPP